MLTSNSKFRHWPRSQDKFTANATSNLESTYLFPEADGPTCTYLLEEECPHQQSGVQQDQTPVCEVNPPFYLLVGVVWIIDEHPTEVVDKEGG